MSCVHEVCAGFFNFLHFFEFSLFCVHTTCLLLLWRVIGGMHEIQSCSFNVRIYFEESWWWSGTTIQLGTHVWTCLGTPNGTCITVGSEVVDLERLSGQIVICFKGLDWVLTKKWRLFLEFIMECTYLYTVRYFYITNII